MRDAAGHLAEGAQTLLLHDRVLRLPQVVVGMLERAVQLSLVRGERDVLTELLQELAVGAGEGMRLPSRRDERPEDLVLDDQRCDDERAQIAAGQALRERILDTSRTSCSQTSCPCMQRDKPF